MNFYGRHSRITKIIKQYLAMPYLPAKQFLPRLRRIKKLIHQIEATESVARAKLLELHKNYFIKFWYRQIRPERISVFGLQHRTNNNMESLHKTMKKNLPTKPNFPRFIERIKKKIFEPQNQLLTARDAGENIQPKVTTKQDNKQK